MKDQGYALKAITTRYHGPTDRRGSRITATDSDESRPNRVTIPYNDELSSYEMHRFAARELMRKMGWDNDIVTGHIKDGMVHVMLHR